MFKSQVRLTTFHSTRRDEDLSSKSLILLYMPSANLTLTDVELQVLLNLIGQVQASGVDQMRMLLALNDKVQACFDALVADSTE